MHQTLVGWQCQRWDPDPCEQRHAAQRHRRGWRQRDRRARLASLMLDNRARRRREPRRHPCASELGDDRELQDHVSERAMGPGNRHLVLDGKEMSMVEGCTIVGVREGIVTHMTMVDVMHNHIGATSLRVHHDGRDVDGSDQPQRRARRARRSGSSVSTTPSARSSTTRSSARAATRRATRRARASRSRRTSSPRRRSSTTVIASPGGIQAFDGSTVTR